MTVTRPPAVLRRTRPEADRQQGAARVDESKSAEDLGAVRDRQPEIAAGTPRSPRSPPPRAATPSRVVVATTTPARAASRTPRRGVHCKVGTMAPVPWSAALVTTDNARIPKSANIPVSCPPSHALASGGGPEGSSELSMPMIVPSPTTATAVTTARIQLERTLQIRAHSARADAGEDRGGAHRAAPSDDRLDGPAVVVDAVLGEGEIGVLEGLLDVREVVDREAEGLGEVADLRRTHPRDLELAGRGPDDRCALGQGAVQVVVVRGPDPHPPAPEAAQHLVDVGVGDQAPPTDDHHAVGDQLDLAHEVAGHQHRAPLVGEATQQRPDPADAVQVEAVDRLVEEQHLGVTQQGSRDPESLPHPQGVPLHPSPGGGAQAHLVDDLVDPRQRGCRCSGRRCAGGSARSGRDASPPRRAAPRPRTAARRSPTYRLPLTVALPADGRSSPMTIRMVVDLPAPFGPRKPVTFPASTSKVRSSTARTSP